MVLGDLASLPPAIVDNLGDVLRDFDEVCCGCCDANDEMGRVGVVFATEEKSLIRPHEVTSTLSDDIECCTTIGEKKKQNGQDVTVRNGYQRNPIDSNRP